MDLVNHRILYTGSLRRLRRLTPHGLAIVEREQETCREKLVPSLTHMRSHLSKRERTSPRQARRPSRRLCFVCGGCASSFWQMPRQRRCRPLAGYTNPKRRRGGMPAEPSLALGLVLAVFRDCRVPLPHPCLPQRRRSVSAGGTAPAQSGRLGAHPKMAGDIFLAPGRQKSRPT